MEKTIIAVDLDETLLKGDKTVGEYTLNTLRACKEKGAVIVISTARGYNNTKKFAEIIAADYCCCQLGNLIVDSKGEVIYKRAIDEKVKLNFLNTFNEYTDEIFFDGYHGVFGLADTYLGLWSITPCLREEMEKTEAIQICLKHSESYLEKIKTFCKENNLTHDVMRGADFSFVSPCQTDKWNALDYLVKFLKVDKQNLFVFGDDTTDLKSILNAGRGVAMQNSREEVLLKAKNVTLTNEEEGVAKFLEKELLN